MKVALVTGAAQGLGKEVCGQLAAQEYTVVLTARNTAKGQQAAEELAGSLVNSVCPGWVKTNMGGPQAPRSLPEGAKGIVWAATLPSDGPTGGFFRDGKPLAW